MKDLIFKCDGIPKLDMFIGGAWSDEDELYVAQRGKKNDKDFQKRSVVLSRKEVQILHIHLGNMLKIKSSNKQ